MKIHIETASPAPRAVLRFLNGLFLLRYGLAAAQAAAVPADPNGDGGPVTLTDAYFGRSVARFDSVAVSQLIQLGQRLQYPGGNGSAPFSPLDEVNPLEQRPFSAFPLEGFAVETLLAETVSDDGFGIVSLGRGSIDLVIEDGLERIREWLKWLLGHTLDAARAGDAASRRNARHSLHDALRTILANPGQSQPAPPFSPPNEVPAGVLLVASEVLQASFAQMNAASLTVSE